MRKPGDEDEDLYVPLNFNFETETDLFILFSRMLPRPLDDLTEEELRSLALNQYGRMYELADGNTYFSPNSTHNVSLPEDHMDSEMSLFRRNKTMLKDFQRPLWYDRLYPSLPFIPLHPFFDDVVCAPLRRQLDLDEDFVRGKDGLWRLPFDVVEGWVKLEEQTKWLIACCNAFKPQETCSLRYPSDMGYQRGFKELRHAVFYARRSREWFMVLFAHATWHLSRHNTFSRPDREESSMWKYVAKHVNKTFLRAFVNSTIITVSPQIRRVGCFYDVSKDSNRPELIAHHLNRFLYYSIPVWIPWGPEVAKIFRHQALQQFRPNNKLLDAFNAEKAQRIIPKQPLYQDRSTIETWRNMVAARNEGPTLPIPMLKPWESFFEQREEGHAARLEVETPGERQSRLERERYAKTSWSSTSKFYKWELDNTVGVYKRRLLSKEEIEDEICGRPTSQLRFDPFCDEWDIGSDFDDESEIMFENDSDNESECEEPSDPGHYDLPQVPTMNSHLVPSSSLAEENTHYLTGRMASRIPLLFGLDIKSPPTNLPPMLKEHQTSVYRAYGGQSQPKPLPDVPLNRYLYHVFLTILQAKNPQRVPQIPRFDLSPLDSAVSTRIIQLVTHIDGHYIIHTPSPSPLIVVYRPEAAVFCCRLPDTSYEAMALALYRHGIRFKACIEANVAPPPPASTYIFPVLPPFVPEDTVLDEVAYKKYVQDRALYLVGHCRRRAALLCGGLISRIARDTIGDDAECERLVVQGPSPSVFGSLFNVVLDLGDGSYLYDDDFDMTEMDYILGVYFYIMGAYIQIVCTYVLLLTQFC
jgi:hypothetical protein